jgi:hypothetical protein
MFQMERFFNAKHYRQSPSSKHLDVWNAGGATIFGPKSEGLDFGFWNALVEVL